MCGLAASTDQLHGECVACTLTLNETRDAMQFLPQKRQMVVILQAIFKGDRKSDTASVTEGERERDLLGECMIAA